MEKTVIDKDLPISFIDTVDIIIAGRESINRFISEISVYVLNVIRAMLNIANLSKLVKDYETIQFTKMVNYLINVKEIYHILVIKYSEFKKIYEKIFSSISSSIFVKLGILDTITFDIYTDKLKTVYNDIVTENIIRQSAEKDFLKYIFDTYKKIINLVEDLKSLYEIFDNIKILIDLYLKSIIDILEKKAKQRTKFTEEDVDRIKVTVKKFKEEILDKLPDTTDTGRLFDQIINEYKIIIKIFNF